MSAGADIDTLYRKWLIDSFGYLLPNRAVIDSTAFMLLIASAPGIGKRQKQDAIAALRVCNGTWQCNSGTITYRERLP